MSIVVRRFTNVSVLSRNVALLCAVAFHLYCTHPWELSLGVVLWAFPMLSLEQSQILHVFSRFNSRSARRIVLKFNTGVLPSGVAVSPAGEYPKIGSNETAG
jgi:hypothetical protein